MNFIPLAGIKTKQVKINAEDQESVELYARYISSIKGMKYEASDVITKILLDDSLEKDLKHSEEEPPIKTRLKLPEAAWEKFTDLSKKSGFSQVEMLHVISKKLLSDKKFVGWKKSELEKT